MTEAPPKGERIRQAMFWLMLVIAIVLVGWALKATASVVLPLIFAFFVAIAIAPLDRRLRAALPHGLRWLAHLLSLLLLLAILGTFFAGIGIAARQVLQKFPPEMDSVSEMVGGASVDDLAQQQQVQDSQPPAAAAQGQQTGGGTATEAQGPAGAGKDPGALTGGDLGDRLGAYKHDLGQMLRERGTEFASMIVSRTVGFVSSLVLVLFLALFLLIEAPQWRQKFTTVLSAREKANWVEVIESTSASLRWFLLVKAVLGLITSALYAGWLTVMGLDLIIVWFVVTFLLNFIPVMGSIIAGLMAAGYAFFQLDFSSAVIAGLGLLAIEQVMGNYVEPKFLGRQLAISPLVVLVSLVLWGWLWGAAGALLATPILIFVLYVAAYHPSLRPLAVLLAERGEDSLKEMTDGR